MPHPFYDALLAHPELLADHLANYLALAREEAETAGRHLVARTVAGVLSAISGLMAIALIGVAAMLGALNGFHWALVAVPAVAVVTALICWRLAARPAPFTAFEDLRAQLQADIEALHIAAGARREP